MSAMMIQDPLINAGLGMGIMLVWRQYEEMFLRWTKRERFSGKRD